MQYQDIEGEKVPSLGLGTWRLSGQECVRAVERALALGYRHIDSAQMYANEGEVGRGILTSGVDREEIFLVTKVWTSNFSYDDVIRSTRESLKKLHTEYVDLLLMHWPNPSVPLRETLGAMAELQEEGSLKHVGVSNFPPSMVEDATRGGGRGGSLVPPSSGSTQVGTTPSLNFRAVFGLDGEVTALEVEP